ncbi:MAG: hypothetical protein V3W44_03750 [Dehalococcoidales bacterium]
MTRAATAASAAPERITSGFLTKHPEPPGDQSGSDKGRGASVSENAGACQT